MLLRYLKQLQAKGQSHVAISQPAREALRAFHRGTITLGGEAGPSPQKGVEEAPPEKAKAPPEPKRAPKPNPKVEITGDTAADQIASLRSQASDWEPVRYMGSLRPTLVFSQGSPTADLMVIGEAPGYHDELAKAPFAGPAGDKLSLIFTAMGLERTEVYLTNICKNRPALPGQTSNSRRARPEEIELYLPFLLAEIEVVKPQIIVALGAAAQAILKTRDPIDTLRGEWHELAGVPLRVSQHPSFLLPEDKDTLPEKRKLWEDMLVVMERLALPISDKQRRFFLPKKT